MSYIIMRVRDQRRYANRNAYQCTRYDDASVAKRMCTRLNNKGPDTWEYMTEEEFTVRHDPLVPVYNRISGDGKTPIMIRKSDVGTINDPSTERYHTL
jgi:hypothetical protein